MTEPLDRPKLLTQLVGHYIDIDNALTGPGLEPWHGLICDGFVRAAAAVLTGRADNGSEFLRDVTTAFVGMVGAVEELAEFEADVNAYLSRRDLTHNPAVADAMYERLERDRRYWTDRLGSCIPLPSVVGL